MSDSPVTLSMAADRATVTVGDPITLTFTVRHPKGYEIVSFDSTRSLDALTLLDRKEGSPRDLPDGQVEEVRTVVLAAYETGSKEVPPVKVVYKDAAGKEGEVQTSTLKIDVASVLTQGQTEPADIKPVASMPALALWPWFVLGALLLAAAVAYVLWRRARRKPEAEVVVAPAPARPAHEIAYAELERLLSSGLLERGETKRFYIELAEILRRYIGARFGIDTLDRTTAEILEALRARRLPVRTTALVGEFLLACDLVKFAKHRPASDETRRTVEAAYQLVDETKAAPVAPEPPLAAAVEGAA